MGTIDEEAASKFINALIKSVQTLCHGYLDFDTGIEIIGHINLSVDKIGSLDYILKEKVCRNDENSTLFISNSFHAHPKSEQPVKPKNSQPESQVVQRRQSSDSSESGKLTSAISSISSALSSAKDSSGNASSSRPQQSTAKRKAHDDLNSDHRSAKAASRDSHFLSSHSQPSPNDTRTSSPLDSKASLSGVTAGYEGSPRTSGNEDVHGSATMLPQTASVTSDNPSDLDVNLAGSVLERVDHDDQSNSEMAEKDDSDLDLEVTFIKEEFVEGERSACEFQGSGGGQQYSRVSHHRGSASSDGMGEQPLFPVALHSNAAATYVPGGQDMMGMAQHYGVQPGAMGPSTSQPQPGPSGMRGVPDDRTSVDLLSPSLPGPHGSSGLPVGQSFGSSLRHGAGTSNKGRAFVSHSDVDLRRVQEMCRTVEKGQLMSKWRSEVSEGSSDASKEAIEREKRRVMKRMYRATLPESKKSEIRLRDAERKRMKRATGIKPPTGVEPGDTTHSIPSLFMAHQSGVEEGTGKSVWTKKTFQCVMYSDGQTQRCLALDSEERVPGGSAELSSTFRPTDAHFQYQKKKFRCSICKAVLTRLDNYKRHLHVQWTDHHSIQQQGLEHLVSTVSAHPALTQTANWPKKIFKCALCGYSNSRFFNYKRHMRCHTGDMFQCDLCGLQYTCKYRLQKHKELKHGIVRTEHQKSSGSADHISDNFGDQGNCVSEITSFKGHGQVLGNRGKD
ncbi:hypothetical protein BaRGS_00027502 [Batillaria attramentaria]|uniref:C2H2-type domain-containing protein n=1 Tax=Batillaria attramentaria TaxID=370345 RepID=A0ABD0K2E1_9CAEN